MEKAIIWPFSGFLCTLLKYETFFEYEITKIIINESSNLAKIIQGQFGDKWDIPYDIANDLKVGLNQSGTILLTADEKTDIEYLEEKIIKNRSMIFKIIDISEYDVSKASQIQAICKDHSIDYTRITSKVSDISLSALHKSTYEINTPIIVIFSDNEDTCKFNTQLILRNQFTSDGYRASIVGSKPYCELLGFHSFPSFMYESNISEVDKILKFNKFIKNIETDEKPDLIIISIPGSFIAFNSEFHRGYGVLHYEVFSAISPDITVMNLLFENYCAEDLYEIEQMVKYRFGVELDFISFSNTRANWSKLLYSSEGEFMKLGKEYINEHIKRYEGKVYNCIDNDSQYELYKNIVNKLIDYSEIQRI